MLIEYYGKDCTGFNLYLKNHIPYTNILARIRSKAEDTMVKLLLLRVPAGLRLQLS